MRKQSLLVLVGAAALALGCAAGGAPAHAGACPASHPAPAKHVVRRHAWRRMAMRRSWRAYPPMSAMRHDWGEEGGEGRWAYGYAEHEHGSFNEEGRGWSSRDGGEWAEEGFERPSATDRFGYLTWPGKTHFLAPPPGPDAGPPAEGSGPPPPPGVLPPPPPPPEGQPPPPPPGDRYEIYRF